VGGDDARFFAVDRTEAVIEQNQYVRIKVTFTSETEVQWEEMFSLDANLQIVNDSNSKSSTSSGCVPLLASYYQSIFSHMSRNFQFLKVLHFEPNRIPRYIPEKPLYLLLLHLRYQRQYRRPAWRTTSPLLHLLKLKSPMITFQVLIRAALSALSLALHQAAALAAFQATLAVLNLHLHPMALPA